MSDLFKSNDLSCEMNEGPKARPSSMEIVTIVTDAEGNHRVTRVESEYRFAFGLRNGARVMAKHARATTNELSYELKAYVTGAIVLAYASLEAFLNEFIIIYAISKESQLAEREKSIIRAIASENLRPQDKKNTVQTFNVMLRLIGKPEFDEGAEPFQSAMIVNRLRNSLVHPLPEKVVTFTEYPDENLSEQQQIVKQLRSRLLLEQDATYPWDILTARCADWAVDACETFIRDFVRISGVDPGFTT